MGPIAMEAIEHNGASGARHPPPSYSATKKRVTKVRAPKPAEPVQRRAEALSSPPRHRLRLPHECEQEARHEGPGAKPVEPVQTTQAPAESAPPAPAPAARKRSTPVAAAPQPAASRPAPATAATPTAPAPTPKATASTKPAETADDADKQKKKKESFWKRTYPSNPPPQ
jgi:hypothetical protein